MASPDLSAVTEAGHVLIGRKCFVETVFVRNPDASTAADLLLYDASSVDDVDVGTTAHVRRFGIAGGFCGTIIVNVGFDSGLVLAARTAGTTDTAPAADLDVTVGIPGAQ